MNKLYGLKRLKHIRPFDDTMNTKNMAAQSKTSPPLGGVYTHPGQRDTNEDNHWPPNGQWPPYDISRFIKKGYLFIVADGMGGYAAGEVASQIAVSVFSDSYYNDPDPDVPASLKRAVLAADTAIRKAQNEQTAQAQMGCTLVAGVLLNDELVLAHVGDSRCYRLRYDNAVGHRAARLKQLTTDHSWVAEQVKHQILTPAEARNHPYRSTLTHALGQPGISPEPDINTLDWQADDRLLLCSDGLWETLEDKQLGERLLQFSDSRAAAKDLVMAAVQAQGEDNITALVLATPTAVAKPRSGGVSKLPLPFLMLGIVLFLGVFLAIGALALPRITPTALPSTTTIAEVVVPSPVPSALLPTSTLVAATATPKSTIASPMSPTPTVMQTPNTPSNPISTPPIVAPTSTIMPPTPVPPCRPLEFEKWQIARDNSVTVTRDGVLEQKNLYQGFGAISESLKQFERYPSLNLNISGDIMPISPDKEGYILCYANNINDIAKCSQNNINGLFVTQKKRIGTETTFNHTIQLDSSRVSQYNSILIKVIGRYSIKIKSVQICHAQ